jgi:hypothetical protein
MNPMTLTELVYLVLGIAAAAWVAEILARSGRVLLVDAQPRQAALARSRIHLMKVGFYLLSLGYVARKLRTGGSSSSLEHAGRMLRARLSMDIVAGKIGTTLVVLGVLLLCHAYALHRMRHRELLAGSLPSGEPGTRPPAVAS